MERHCKNDDCNFTGEQKDMVGDECRSCYMTQYCKDRKATVCMRSGCDIVLVGRSKYCSKACSNAAITKRRRDERKDYHIPRSKTDAVCTEQLQNMSIEKFGRVVDDCFKGRRKYMSGGCKSDPGIFNLGSRGVSKSRGKAS